MSLWAKFKNYFFGVPMPTEKVSPSPVVPIVEPTVPAEPKQEMKVEEAKRINLEISEPKQEATVTVVVPTVEVKAPEPEKKKAAPKKRSAKKKSN